MYEKKQEKVIEWKGKKNSLLNKLKWALQAAKIISIKTLKAEIGVDWILSWYTSLHESFYSPS